MEKTTHKPPKKPGHKIGKMFFLFAILSIIALPILVSKAFSVDNDQTGTQVNDQPVPDFDHNARQLYDHYTETTPAYMQGSSTARTLDYYYSLRQYPGSPPVIPHSLTDEAGDAYKCLSCHEKGGFTQSMNRFTPVTPHPQHTACDQCHVKADEMPLFSDINWVSVQPPKLGISALAGSPPPIAHSLQMRENCIACHVGPGTVVPIRVEHSMRGNCRQCHVSLKTGTLFTRTPKE